VPAAATTRKTRHAATPLPATRDVILDTAERLFAARGVDGVAVRALAREMGITASSLYNHFPGKQALYDAVVDRGLRPIVELVAVAWQPGHRPEHLQDTLDRLTTHLARHPHLASLLQRALLEGSGADLVERWVSSLYEQGTGVLRRIARDAGWETAEIPHLSVALFGMIFAYFTNAPALQRLASWSDDPLSARALGVQRRFLGRAILRLLGPLPAAGAAAAARRRQKVHHG
jgi:AcrR family transcriptional regulator